MKTIRFLCAGVIACMTTAFLPAMGQQTASLTSRPNLAVIATPSGPANRFGGGNMLNSLNDGLAPTNQGGRGGGGRQQQQQPRSMYYVQYDWKQPVTTKEIAVYWWNYNNNVRLPMAYRIQYWDGSNFVPVKNAAGLGLTNNQLNNTTFDEVKTTRLRLELDSADRFSAALLEWVVFPAEDAPHYAPMVTAGGDRSVMTGGKTYLAGQSRSVTPISKYTWTKTAGPGNVQFSNPNSKDATATFSAPGEYELTLTATEGSLSSSSSLKVSVHQPPKSKRLDVVYTKRYKIDSKLWNDRIKMMIVNWIPHCIEMINRNDITTGEGGIDNFIEAAKALRGEQHARHKGYVFSNAWVHQTVESMCIALMVDPQGDKEMIAAQEKMKKTLDEWIPIILSAQEPDGYLQTAFTLRDTARWRERWSPQARGNHEGYVAGYFIESAINHYTLTEGKDKRLYNAAKKLADCWVANISPGKRAAGWFDGHQEMEQALVRFGRFVNDMEGKGSHGDSYINLAKRLLDNRRDGSDYDQSLVPVQQQYEAVGHAVRATYTYSGMADVAAETGDVDYQSAVMSLWDNMVNKKYYLTGGIGSGETSEGFGGNYSLRNGAYCESCSSCGLIFFQYKMNLAYHDAKYADLYEETMYNALLGSLDLEAKNFYYTNALSSSQARYAWHVCPCCVGNIPRTLLMVPTWSYVTGDDGLYVNMFIGSTVNVERVVGTDVQMVQKTDYPWSGNVSITVNPKQSKEFTVYVRVPNRTTSELYTPKPAVTGLKSLSVNGKVMTPKIENGYAIIRRVWKKGDKIDVVLPMEVQQITADERIEADRGRVAFRYGPLIYNVETADQQDINKSVGSSPFTIEWRPELLRGVMAIKGTWSDGSPLLAIPNYTRLNRNVQPTPVPQQGGDRNPTSIIWVKKE